MMDIQKSTVPRDAEILVSYRCPGSDTVFLQYGRDPLPPWAVVVREVKRGCQLCAGGGRIIERIGHQMLSVACPQCTTDSQTETRS